MDKGMKLNNGKSQKTHAVGENQPILRYEFKSAQGLHIKPDFVVQAPTPLGQREVPKPKDDGKS